MNDEMHSTRSTRILPAIGPLAAGLLTGSVALGAAVWALGPRPAPAPNEAAGQPPEPTSAVAVAPGPTSVPEPVAEPDPEPEPEPIPAVAIALDDGEPGVDYLERVEAALEKGDLKSALRALRRHAGTNPHTVDVLLRIGRFARELDRLELSEAALSEAAELEPAEPEVWLQLARTRLAQDRYEAAALAAEVFVKARPHEAVGFNLLGRAEMGRSRWEAAEIAFEQGIDLDPSNAHLFNNLGLLRIRARKGPGAVQALETAVDLFGSEVPAYTLNNLGLAYELVGELEAARGAYEDALAVRPLYVNARVNAKRVDEKLAARYAATARRVADVALGGADGPEPAPEPGESDPTEAGPFDPDSAP